jgi:hypothetical protein
MKLYMFRGSSSAHHQEFIHCTLGTGTCSILVLLEICLQTCMTCTSSECTLNKLLMMGRGTTPKHVLGKLVHLVGFVIKEFVTMQHGHVNVKN